MVLTTSCGRLPIKKQLQSEQHYAQHRDTTNICEVDPTLAECHPISPLLNLDNIQQNHALILDYGSDALLARVHLFRHARKSIDLQTYIFGDDDSSQLVIDELVNAAKRGVKVRLLVDQLSAFSNPPLLAALTGAHQNISIKLYNPAFNKSKIKHIEYAENVLCCFRDFNQRMHNKLMIIDNEIAITGGRNIQDNYFDWSDEYNFRDRDVLVTGEHVLSQMQTSFLAFWESKHSVKTEHLKDIAQFALKQTIPSLSEPNYINAKRSQQLLNDALDNQIIQTSFVTPIIPVERIEYIADTPEKHTRASRKSENRQQQAFPTRYYLHDTNVAPTTPYLDQLIFSAQDNIILQTPYWVLSKNLQHYFQYLNNKPQPPQLLLATNSLAGTDNPIVYAMGYKYKRRDIHDFKISIYELKPYPETIPFGHHYLKAIPDNSPKMRRSRIGLHAKSMVVDNNIGIISSHNFDPRSENYNTESALVIEDKHFANLLKQSIFQDISPENSWRNAPRYSNNNSLNYTINKFSETLPVFDLWPRRYARNYEFQKFPECQDFLDNPFIIPNKDKNFEHCYQSVGDFPETTLGLKRLLRSIITGFAAAGSGLL